MSILPTLIYSLNNDSITENRIAPPKYVERLIKPAFMTYDRFLLRQCGIAITLKKKKDPNLNGKFIFNRGTKEIQCGKERIFNKRC